MMRAKFRVTEVTKGDNYERVRMSAVCKNEGYPADGTDEDNTFALWSPSGSFEITITNPALHGKFEVGQKFYSDWTLAAK